MGDFTTLQLVGTGPQQNATLAVAKGEGNVLLFNQSTTTTVYMNDEASFDTTDPSTATALPPLATVVHDGTRNVYVQVQTGQSANVAVIPGGVSFFQLVELIVKTLIVDASAGNGIFIYNGTGALGNPPIGYWVPSGVTHDPFGNTITNTGAGIYSVGASGLYVEVSAAALTFGGGTNISNGLVQQVLGSLRLTSPVTIGGTTAAVLNLSAGTPPQFLTNGPLVIPNNLPPTPPVSGAAQWFAESGHGLYQSGAGNNMDTGRFTAQATGQTISSTSFTPILGMSAPVESGIKYRFRAFIEMFSNAAAGQWQVELLGPAATVLNYGFRFTAAAGTGGLNVNETAYGVVLGGPAVSANSAYWIEIEGTVTPSANGNLSVDGLATVAADTWTVYIASYLEVLPII